MLVKIEQQNCVVFLQSMNMMTSNLTFLQKYLEQ